MLTSKTVSVERVIEKLLREYPFIQSVDWIDFLEYIGDCIDLIGSNASYIAKITDGNEDLGHPSPILIENYRGQLPCDLVKVNQVREWCNKSPMVYSSDSFHSATTPCYPTVDTTELSEDFGQTSLSFNSELAVTLNNTSDSCNILSYNLNNNYIFTSFESGQVEMAYTAFPTDVRGYPLIPDDIKFITACAAYVAEREGFKLWLSDKLADRKYDKLVQERSFYIGAANTRGNMPSKDKMESLKNQWLRLIPRVNEHSNFFKGLSEPGKFITHNSY
jgi:hypothetical protein